MTRDVHHFLVRLAVAAAIAACGVGAPVDAETVARFDAAGELLWSRALEPAAAAAPLDRLAAAAWFPPFPDVEIPLLDGGSFHPSEAQGEILLLDFWATWCEPCLREMPRLQRLQDEWRGRGLRIVTINSGEAPLVALDYLDALEIDLLAGSYGDALRDAMPLRQLPTLVLIDPETRLRQVWNGYSEGLVERVAERVAELLAPGGMPREPVADVLAGAGLLRLDWARRIGGTDGLAVARFADDADGGGGPRLVATTVSETIVLDAEGVFDTRGRTDPAAGALRVAADRRSGSLLGFRPGGRRVVALDASLTWSGTDLPSYVLDVASTSDARSSALAATVDGLMRREADGWIPFGEPVETRAIAIDGERIGALRAPATVAWYAADGSVTGETTLPFADPWRLATAPDGDVFVADGRVAALATARLAAGTEPVVVAVTAGGRLVLLDPRDGDVLFDAVWKRSGPLAVGDLDGDGLDEIAFATGGRVFLLRTPR